jgi:DNA-binding MarR family transcriptional regulator
MVKLLDENSFPPVIDHVGWRLWQASELWKAQLDSLMAGKGHLWFAEARGNIVRHLGPRGLPQAVLAARMGLTKQAVQQLLDELVADGIVERKLSPGDKRSNLVVFTAKGLKAMRDANEAKRLIETRCRRLLGDEKFKAFMRTLEAMTAALSK